MPRVKLFPGTPSGRNWVWCQLCAVQVHRTLIDDHEKTNTHRYLWRVYSTDEALDKVIPPVYDDRHYGLMESDAAALDNRL